MDLHLQGKTAIVTGGSAGIGFACAKALYQEGVHVLIAARDEEKLKRAAMEIRREASLGEAPPQVVTVSGDISQSETVSNIIDTAIEQFGGKIDILINSAGAARSGAFFEMPDDVFLDAWNLKLLGYIRMVKAVGPYMIKQQDGRIVNIVGGAGRTPNPHFLAGSTANAALLNFTRGISKELAQHNVRINAISPGTTATERARQLAEQRAALKGISVEEELAETTKRIPLGKMVDPDEIAAMALLLVSDRSASITGIEVLIDGGQQPGV